jgi:hypothetical protein
MRSSFTTGLRAWTRSRQGLSAQSVATKAKAKIASGHWQAGRASIRRKELLSTVGISGTHASDHMTPKMMTAVVDQGSTVAMRTAIRSQ